MIYKLNHIFWIYKIFYFSSLRQEPFCDSLIFNICNKKAKAEIVWSIFFSILFNVENKAKPLRKIGRV